MGKAKSPLTITQKIEFLAWYASHRDKPSQAACAAWIKMKFNATVSQSSISKIINNKTFENLDPKQDPGLQNTRISSAEWPVLENILHNWQLMMESRSLSTSREVLQNKARWIWLNVLEARNGNENTDTVPTFGRKWCTGFLKRWSISEHTFHGEANDAQRYASQPDVQDRMANIRSTICHHEPDDI